MWKFIHRTFEKIWAGKNIQVVNIQVLELGNRQMYDPAQLYIGRYIALLCCPKQRQRQKRQTHMKSSTALLYVRDKDACPRCLVASLYDHDAQALTWGDLHFYQEHNLNCRHQHQTYQSHGQRSRGQSPACPCGPSTPSWLGTFWTLPTQRSANNFGETTSQLGNLASGYNKKKRLSCEPCHRGGADTERSASLTIDRGSACFSAPPAC